MDNHIYSNQDIRVLLRLVGDIYAALDKNRFSVNAYRNAADTVEKLDRPLFSIWREGKLSSVQGFAGSIGEHIDELFRTGSSEHFDKVKASIPSSFAQLIRVPSIGPKKAYALIRHLGCTNGDTVFNDIIQAVHEDKIASIPNFGSKSQEDIKRAIEDYLRSDVHDGRMLISEAEAIAQTVIDYLKKHPAVEHIDVLGSLRRWVSTIGDIDLAVVAPGDEARAIIDHFTMIPSRISVENAGEKKASIIYPPRVRVDIRIQDSKTYGAMLQYFTGSKAHNVQLREYAQDKGYSLSEYGIKKVHKHKDDAAEKMHTFDNEEDFYAFLGLDYIEPELREGTHEIEDARAHTLPHLITVDDMKGDFHIHSSYDIVTSHDVGAHTYEEIVARAKQLGYQYVGFADHNPRQKGHSDDDIVAILKRRKEHIDRVLSDSPLPFYVGLEVDILPDGVIAIPEEATTYLDYVMISIHSSFSQDVDMMTRRYLKAMDFPKVRIIGHPMGRLLHKREGVQADWNAIFEKARDCNIALEINATPSRLDLPDSLVRQAQEKGCIFAIGSDAHDVNYMAGVRHGVSVARRGWLESQQVVNTWSRQKVGKWLVG